MSVTRVHWRHRVDPLESHHQTDGGSLLSIVPRSNPAIENCSASAETRRNTIKSVVASASNREVSLLQEQKVARSMSGRQTSRHVFEPIFATRGPSTYDWRRFP